MTVILRDLAYPLKIVDGGLATATDTDVVRDSILSVLETRPFERIMRPQYGTSNLAFEAHPNPSVVAERIRQALELQITDATFEVLGQVNEDGSYLVTITWSTQAIEQPPIQYRLVI
ncbi:MAG: hypothetical protein EBZ77_03565 [Chitinophagia bacterium]|nr:hypothetical protein [Chitinophagia bacterium]